MRTPRCLVIAGPNGAGKTTFAREFLPREAAMLHFVNADLIAAGLSPLKPELALRRIQVRVKQGGHSVPDADVRRRIPRGWRNFIQSYRPLADAWAVYDNSGPLPVLLEKSS